MLYRVRQEAAMALATTASLDTEFAGFQILLKVFKARCHSSSSSSIAAPQIQAGQNPLHPLPHPNTLLTLEYLLHGVYLAHRRNPAQPETLKIG